MSEEARTSVRISELELALGGKYRILGRIGAGGFGEVYLGEHTTLKRKVAIKILLQSISTQQELVQRFQREARSAAALSHPNIIDIYDVGEGEGIYYFVMKYIDGETLSHKMQREKRINPAEAIRIFQQVADALDYAHANDVVHRDIKPANVMLDSYGKPLLMDFGVARVQYEGNLTKTGTLLGTPHYLAPEQPLGKPVDGRSDIYSLGIMFYEMLAGRPPFHDENSITLIFKHINEAPVPLNSLVPDLDPELCLIIHKMIEKNPDNRYQTAAEVAEALQRLSGVYPIPTPTIARRTTPGAVRNTEKLLLLAKEHLDQEKLDKAIEIFGTIARRDPQNATAKKQISEMIPKLVEKTRNHIKTGEFKLARDLISQVSSIVPDNPELQSVREELAKEEDSINHQLATELQEHFQAAQVALEKDDASSAVEHLTRAATINSSSSEVQELLKQTEGRFTSQINLLCESLDFTGAEKMMELGKQAFPDLMATKIRTVERHHSMYRTLANARELGTAGKLEEAEKAYNDFLQNNGSYDFEVFHTLRKEAEEELARLKEKKTPIPVAIPIAAQKIAEPASTVSAKKPAFSIRRIAVILGAGIALAGIVFAFTAMLNRQNSVELNQPDISIFNRLTTKAKNEEAAAVKPVVGELSVTSDPAGATVFMGDQQKGVTPLKLSDMQFGRYTVLLKLKGYKDQSMDVELKQESAAVELPFVMEAVIQVVGSLTIDSTPQGAYIAINNRVLGVTPKSIDKMNVGKYTIILKKDGYLDYSESVRVKENEKAVMNATLQEIPKAAPVVVEKPKEEVIQPGTLVTLGPDVVPPKALKKTAVSYPETAQKQKLEGTVKLNLLISETGQVADVKVVDSAHPILDEAAAKTVRGWTYEPARKKGVPVKVWITTSITFVKR